MKTACDMNLRDTGKKTRQTAQAFIGELGLLICLTKSKIQRLEGGFRLGLRERAVRDM